MASIATDQPRDAAPAVYRWLGPSALALGLVFLLAPRLSGWAVQHVHKEDGYIFLKEWTRRGPGSILETYTGYLHLLPRLMTGVAAQFPADAFPVVIGVETSLFRVWLGLCLYWVLRSRRLERAWALLGASMFVLVPAGQYEVLGNITNVRWFGDAALVLLVVASLRGVRAGAVALTLFLCALSDPISLTLAPWLLWFLVRHRGVAARCVPGAALVGAVLHWCALDSGARANFISAWLSQPVDLVGQFLVRGWQVAQFGVVGTMTEHRLLGWAPAMMLGLVPLAVFLWARVRFALVLAGAAMYVLGVSIAFSAPSDLTVKHWFAAGQPSRYSLAPSIILAVGGVLAAATLWKRKRRVVPLLMALVLAGGIVLDGRGDPENSNGPTWSSTVREARAACAAGHRSSTEVEFTPTTVSHQWRTSLPCHWLER